jgi:hypothetical protein
LEDGYWTFRLVHGRKDERRATRQPKSEIARAREMRDKWLAEIAARDKAGIEKTADPVAIGAMLKMYRDEQSQPYDREKGGLQPGTKKDAGADEDIVDRLRRAGLDFSLRADLLDTGRIFGLGVSLEKMGFAPLTEHLALSALRLRLGAA